MAKNKQVNSVALRGKDGFESYYKNLFNDRWLLLKESFAKENVYAKIKAPGEGEPYFLDPASVFAAMQLPVGQNIFDMCAAPGGKTLILANRMGQDAKLCCNERSAQRKARLVQVCDSYIPSETRSRVTVTCSDAAVWCKTKSECYDTILLDAPCSSERHVFNDEKYLAQWSPSRIKSLAIEQWALLSCAYRLLCSGGFLLYSTCALNPSENDEVIRRLFKKFAEAKLCFLEKEPFFAKDIATFCQMPFIPEPERTEFGFHILPDKNRGAGPIWFTLIQKPAQS